MTTYGPTSANPQTTTVMKQGWRRLTFLHWPYDPEVVQRLLPEGLTVETYEGSAWVALVPFEMMAKAPIGPEVPWASHFWETNVRTYVIGPDGRTGVWFLSLDASRFGAVAAARLAYSLPYFWSRMRLVERPSDRILLYVTERRWPKPRTHSLVQVRVGEPFAAGELTERDHYLTARFALWAKTRRGLRWTPADHPPWPLHRAELLRLDDHLVTATGLPAPEGHPVIHHSPGVAVRIGHDRFPLQGKGKLDRKHLALRPYECQNEGVARRRGHPPRTTAARAAPGPRDPADACVWRWLLCRQLVSTRSVTSTDWPSDCSPRRVTYSRACGPSRWTCSGPAITTHCCATYRVPTPAR